MAKIEKVDLMGEAKTKMETLVEQHNALGSEIQERSERLSEIKQMILEHQGYMKGLEACEESCNEGEK